MPPLGEILKWVGYVVMFAGLVRSGYYFFNNQVVGGLLTLAIVVVVVTSVLVVRRVTSMTPFTILSTEKTLKFDEGFGHKANHRDDRTVRVNQKGQNEYWFKELGHPESLEAIS